MAINNYIKDMQKQIELKKNMNKLYDQVDDVRTKVRHKFIYDSVVDYTGNKETTFDEAKQFIKDNDVQFKTVKDNGFSAEWLLTINGKEYNKAFTVKLKDKKEEE